MFIFPFSHHLSVSFSLSSRRTSYFRGGVPGTCLCERETLSVCKNLLIQPSSLSEDGQMNRREMWDAEKGRERGRERERERERETSKTCSVGAIVALVSISLERNGQKHPPSTPKVLQVTLVPRTEFLALLLLFPSPLMRPKLRLIFLYSLSISLLFQG